MKYPFLILPGLVLLVTLVILMITSAVVAEFETIKESRRLARNNIGSD